MVYEYNKIIDNLDYLSYLINREITALDSISLDRDVDILYVSFGIELSSGDKLILDGIINNYDNEVTMQVTKNAKSLTKKVCIKKTLSNVDFTYFYERTFTNPVYLQFIQFDFDYDDISYVLEIDGEDYNEEPVDLSKNQLKEYNSYDDEQTLEKYSIENGRSLVRIRFENLLVSESIKIKVKSNTSNNKPVTLVYLFMNYVEEVWV